MYTGQGKQTVRGHKQNLVGIRTQGKRSSDPTRDWARLVCECSGISAGSEGREHSPDLQQKIGLKIYWAPPCPSEQELVSPSVSLSHQEDSISLLFFSIRGQTDWKPVTENLPIWSHGPQPCLTQWNYEPCHVGPSKTDGSWWRVLTKRGPLEKGMANHFSILALRTPWKVWKGKKTRHWKISSPRW